MENDCTISPKIVVAVAFRKWSFMIGSNWKALTGKIFCVLDRQSLMGGGRTWSFDWVINATVDELCNL